MIPEKLTVSKRLSQCFNPSLPSGLHSKTLQVYDAIFDHIKADRLARDLGIYSAGLFPFFVNASIQLKVCLFPIFFLKLKKYNNSNNSYNNNTNHYDLTSTTTFSRMF